LGNLVINVFAQLKSRAFQEGSQPENDQFPIIVYVDEAHGIKDLNAMTSVFATFKEAGVVGIYLSTTSHISYLAPLPHDMPNLARSPGGEVTYLLPFTELYLDTFSHLHFHGHRSELSLRKVRSISAATSLGRPLYVFTSPLTLTSNPHASRIYRVDIPSKNSLILPRTS